MRAKLLKSLNLRRLLGQQRNSIDLYRTSRAWSSTASFSDVDEKNGAGGDADDDLAGSRKEIEFRGVHRAIICGNVGQVPVQKILRNGHTVTVFTVGTGGMFDQRRVGAENLPLPAQWHRIAVHNELLGTYAVQKLVKNAAVYVEGDIETRVYNDRINNQVKNIPEICVRRDGKIHLVQSGGSDVSQSLEELSSGKTTTCSKYAYYHQKKGFKPALVCADTFRAGAFDQLKQNASKANVPFYGSYMESDPVQIAVEGVERFRKENCDLIIVDTSGRHKQEASLFEEMRQVSEATKPDLVIFVMDSSIGQAAFDQAQAFRQSVSVGAVIVTKMDGHAKGGGALSAVAATRSPVVFIGTGEHLNEFEGFDVKPFVKRLLGLGDLSGFIDKIHEVVPTDQQPDLMKRLTEGTFTLRLMYEQFQNLVKMGSIGQIFSMLPGFSSELMPKGHEKESQAKIKRYMTMMDSMTDAELDSANPKLMNESRIARIARGSGRTVRDVLGMLEEYKRLAKVWSKIVKKIPTRNMNAKEIGKAIPPQMLEQLGGMGALQSMIKQLGSK